MYVKTSITSFFVERNIFTEPNIHLNKIPEKSILEDPLKKFKKKLPQKTSAAIIKKLD